MDDDRPVLDQLNLVVGNIDESTAFYRRLGLEIPSQHPWAKDHRNATMPEGVDFDLDSKPFAQTWCKGWSEGRRGPVIGFKVRERATVDRLYAQLTAAGHAGLQAPYDAFWGARYAVVEDPDGNAIGLMSASDEAMRSKGPDPAP